MEPDNWSLTLQRLHSVVPWIPGTVCIITSSVKYMHLCESSFQLSYKEYSSMGHAWWVARAEGVPTEGCDQRMPYSHTLYHQTYDKDDRTCTAKAGKSRGHALVVYSSAASSPLSRQWPHSAKKFHRATPAVLGFAVMTSTSGLHPPLHVGPSPPSITTLPSKPPSPYPQGISRFCQCRRSLACDLLQGCGYMQTSDKVSSPAISFTCA